MHCGLGAAVRTEFETMPRAVLDGSSEMILTVRSCGGV